MDGRCVEFDNRHFLAYKFSDIYQKWIIFARSYFLYLVGYICNNIIDFYIYMRICK